MNAPVKDVAKISPTNAARPRLGPSWDLAAIAFALVLPTLVTWAYFFQAESAPPWVQLTVFPVVKTIQFAFPACWVVLAMRQQVALRRPSLSGALAGLAFGLAVAVAIILLYAAVLRDGLLFQRAAESIREKVAGFSIDSLGEYAALGVFYSVFHSLLEEYYWRWFVFGRLRKHAPLSLSVVVSSLGFMAHHVLVLGKFFGFGSWATWFFSFCVAVGGAAWALLYEKSASLTGPWASHFVVDAAIFAIGYDLVRTTLMG